MLCLTWRELGSPEHIQRVVCGGNSAVAAVAEFLPCLLHQQEPVLHVHQWWPKPVLLGNLPPLMQAIHVLNDWLHLFPGPVMAELLKHHLNSQGKIYSNLREIHHLIDLTAVTILPHHTHVYQKFSKNNIKPCFQVVFTRWLLYNNKRKNLLYCVKGILIYMRQDEKGILYGTGGKSGAKW